MPTYTVNKKAKFDYKILETLEAGLVLAGHEVKSIREGRIQLKGSFVSFHKNEAFLTNAHISRYKYAGKLDGYEPTHSRKLLLSRKQIDFLKGKSMEKGLTIVPLSVYSKGPKIKVELGVAKGKKQYDKRETIKKRDLDREVRRTLKSNNI